jgi:hypothetical protein
MCPCDGVVVLVDYEVVPRRGKIALVEGYPIVDTHKGYWRIGAYAWRQGRREMSDMIAHFLLAGFDGGEVADGFEGVDFV